MIRMMAYQNLYGPVTPNRLDLVIARLGMDVAAPHMKKGRRPKLKDHLLKWSRKTARQTPEQMLAAIKGIQKAFDEEDERKKKQRAKRTRDKQQKDESPIRNRDRRRRRDRWRQHSKSS